MKPLHTNDEAIALLLTGGIGVMPTDTVYGLVARAADEAAVARMYALKSRTSKPGTVIAASVEQLIELGVPVINIKAVAHLWAKPVSIEIQLRENLNYLHQGVGRQAFRIVASKQIRNLLEQTGPLVTSSANQPGQPPSVNLEEAYKYFNAQVDFYVDGGDLSGRAPSTIIRINDGTIVVLREGAVSADELHRLHSDRQRNWV